MQKWKRLKKIHKVLKANRLYMYDLRLLNITNVKRFMSQMLNILV